MKRITVLLADDHVFIREGLRALLKAELDIELVGEAQNGRQAVELTKKLCPAVVVMDIAMPVLNGLEATRQILKAVPATKVIILSAHSDIAYIQQANALGVAGYLIKQSSAQILCKAIRAVQKGNTFFSPSIPVGWCKHDTKFTDPVKHFKKKVASLFRERRKHIHLLLKANALYTKIIENTVQITAL